MLYLSHQWNLIRCWHLTSIFVEAIYLGWLLGKSLWGSDSLALPFPPPTYHRLKDCVCVCLEWIKPVIKVGRKRGLSYRGVFDCMNVCLICSDKPRTVWISIKLRRNIQDSWDSSPRIIDIKPVCRTRPVLRENDITFWHYRQPSRDCSPGSVVWHLPLEIFSIWITTNRLLIWISEFFPPRSDLSTCLQTFRSLLAHM